MENTQALLKALESIAYDKDENDVLHSLDVIRGEVASGTTDSLPVPKKSRRSRKVDWSIKSAAYGMLSTASKVAWSKEKNKKRAIMRVAASYMGQHPKKGQPQERELECSFVVRAVWRGRSAALELVGPVNARPRFLIGYAFWLVAKGQPASVWRRTKRKQCTVCGGTFEDERKRGRPRTYCSNACYEKAHAELDPRRTK